jgi:hypothetical protein
MLDTNVLLRMSKSQDPLHPTISSALQALVSQGARLCFTSQVLGEFWNASTRPFDKPNVYGPSAIDAKLTPCATPQSASDNLSCAAWSASPLVAGSPRRTRQPAPRRRGSDSGTASGTASGDRERSYRTGRGVFVCVAVQERVAFTYVRSPGLPGSEFHLCRTLSMPAVVATFPRGWAPAGMDCP